MQQTRDNLANGFRAIKMKVGRDHLHEDVARVAAMRELLGHEIPLMVDANMRWRVDEAIRASRAAFPAGTGSATRAVSWLLESKALAKLTLLAGGLPHARAAAEALERARATWPGWRRR